MGKRKEEKEILGYMVEIYKTVDYDWMGYKIQKDNQLTVHHICERHNGGDLSMSNLAPITKHGHQKLNKIKNSDPMIFDEWQDLFLEINRSQSEPTEEHKARMLELRMSGNRTIYKR